MSDDNLDSKPVGEDEAEEEKPPQLPFCVGYDKAGRAKCKVCKSQFEKGSFRIGKYGYNPFGAGQMKMWHHLKCLFDSFKKARATTKKIDNVEEDVEDWDTIEPEDQELVQDALREFQDFCKAKGISPTTVPKKDDPKKVKTPAKPDGKDAKNKAQEAPPKEKVNPDEAKYTAKDNSFREFRRMCATIAESNSHLAKAEHVRKFFSKGTKGDKFRGDLELWVRLLLPGVIKRVYNLQSKQLVKVFSQVFQTNHEEMLEDLEAGDVAETICLFFEKSKGVQPTVKSEVTLHQVDSWLSKLEGMSKEEEQIAHLSSVASKCTSNDLKMIVRLIKADLRINAGAKPILDGVHPDAYEAFQTTRNLTAVLQQVREKQGGESTAGTAGGSLPKALSIKAKVLTPVLPMLAQACKSVEQAFKKWPNGMYSEIKYDGERVQLHKTDSEFKYFSRSLKPVMSHKVSHFEQFIPEAFPHGHDLILDAEVLLIDTRTGNPLPFGTLGVHKKSEFGDAQVCLFVFDCIHYNGENLMKKSLKQRRAILLENMTEVEHRVMFSEMLEIYQPQQLTAMIAKVLSEGLEGLVLKDINGIYEPGKRHWLKVKKDYLADGAMADSADLVVLGAWYGTGKKGGMMSVFLMGCRNPATDKWCTVTKVHTGHDDAALERLQTELSMDKISGDYDRAPAWLNCSRTMTPDFVAKDPKNSPVWEITGAEFTQNQIHSADGISIRFPRVTKERADKTWETATNLDQLKELFKLSKEKDFGDILGVPSTSNSPAKEKNGHTSKHDSDKKHKGREEREEGKRGKQNSEEDERGGADIKQEEDNKERKKKREEERSDKLKKEKTDDQDRKEKIKREDSGEEGSDGVKKEKADDDRKKSKRGDSKEEKSDKIKKEKSDDDRKKNKRKDSGEEEKSDRKKKEKSDDDERRKRKREDSGEEDKEKRRAHSQSDDRDKRKRRGDSRDDERSDRKRKHSSSHDRKSNGSSSSSTKKVHTSSSDHD